MKLVKFQYLVYLKGPGLEDLEPKALDLPADSFRDALRKAFPQWGVGKAHESYEELEEALNNEDVVATVSYVDISDAEQRRTYTVRRHEL